MRPIHLSRLRVPGGDVDDLARLHAEWALGLGRFESLRAERVAAGVPESTGIDDLVEKGGEWTFKFGLPERDGITRTSAIRISSCGSEVLVEHLVTRDGPPSSVVAPTAAPPDVVPWMLANIPNLEPAGLRSTAATRIEEIDVPPFVDEILSAKRDIPIILAAIENTTRETLVDADEIGRRLAGMARVFQLASVRTSYRLREELIDREMPEKFGCYNGGVRVLRPGIQAHDNPYDHLLLLPVRLMGILAKSRSEQVAGIFCELIAEGEDPRRWLRELDPAGAASSTRSPTRTPTRAKTPTRPLERDEPAKLGSLPAMAGLARAGAPEPRGEREPGGEPEPSRVEHEGASPGLEIVADAPRSRPPEVEHERPLAGRSSSTWSVLADDLTAALQLAAEQEQEFHAVQQELADARRLLRRAQQERDEIAGPPASATDALVRAEALYPDRLIILRSARTSAADSSYRDAGRVLFVLSLLANCDANTFGEVLAKALGGSARWKPRDSPETVAKFGKDRTFTDSSKKSKLFGRHVTLGHGVSPKKCLQIYYDVLGDGRIEIAWCGEHRPTVSEDT